MQFKFKQQKKYFQKKHFISNPHFFWMLLLLMMFIIMVISFAFGVYMFFKVSAEPVVSAEELGGQGESVNMEKINKALKYFSDRDIKSSDVLNFGVRVVDPSL